MFKKTKLLLPVIGFLSLAAAPPAGAGQPKPWQMGFQDPASPVMERIIAFHDILTYIIVAIVLLVMSLLGYVLYRFNAKRNPNPSKIAHNTLLEAAWTAFPVIILVAIAFPSLKLLYYMDRAQDAEMTLKVVGHQWYWSYEYPDHGDLAFDSVMVPEDELEPGQPRLLETDYRVVLPVNTTVRVIVTSEDVIHSWALPALGLKTDAVPGRINETWVRIDREGLYYGQCSELCGVNHGFMPVAIEAVSKKSFAAWLDNARKEFAGGLSGTARMSRLAAVDVPRN